MLDLHARSVKLDPLTFQLVASGAPIDGVTLLRDGSVRVDFRPEATDEQKAAAQSIVDAFDWTPRRPKTQAALLTAIQALSTSDRNKLLAAMAAEFLREHPDFARKLSIALDGDEPVQ